MTAPRLFAIDPGPTESAWLELAANQPVAFAKEPNAVVLDRILASEAHYLAIEMAASYGMPVGQDVFSTVVWSGRFIQRWVNGPHGHAEGTVLTVYRKDVTLHLCHSRSAGDKNVRQALIDRYGPGKSVAIGLKASPGPLHGVSGDVWAALGVGVTAADRLAVPDQLAIVPAGCGAL